MASGDGKKNGLSRREFLAMAGRGISLLAVGSVMGLAWGKGRRDGLVWQIDPFRCVQCGNCATRCVLDPSAVKCVHDFSMCGYCKPCFGFFRTTPAALDSGAENQTCPTGALTRRFVEDPYYEYTVSEKLCVGCGKCVKGCTRFGNGSLHLQVRHDRCMNCNECSIAAACPSNAFVRLPAASPYVIKHNGPRALEGLRHW